MKKIDSSPIEPYFLAYKQSSSKEDLEELFSVLDPIITNVLRNISRRFRSHHYQDFEDLMQTAKMEIYTYLPKICIMSLDVEQLIRIIVSAAIFRFKASYRVYKTKNPVVFSDLTDTNSYWTPDNKVPIFCSIEDFNNVPTLYNFYELNGTMPYVKGPDSKEKLITNTKVSPNQELSFYIDTFKERLNKKIKEINRYKEHEEAILLCIDRIINKSEPSKKMFKHVFDVHANYNFIVAYAEIILKIAFFSLLKEDRGNLFFHV